MNKELFISDGIEGNEGGLETFKEEILEIESSYMSGELSEGDVIIKEDASFKVDKEETKKRRETIKELTKDIWR